MASLAHALRSFREGEVSGDELLAETDRILAEGRGNAAWLLDTLDREHGKAALPDELYAGVKQRIEAEIQRREAEQAAQEPEPEPVSKPASAPEAGPETGAAPEPDQPPPAEPSQEDVATTFAPEAQEDLSETRLATRFAGSASPPEASAQPVRPVTPSTQEPPPPVEPIKGVGDVLNDRFVLEERVGAGGMSTVYKALDRRKLEAHDRNPYVAVKILNVEFRAHPQSLIALQREAKKSQSLAHPNIVRVYDFDRDGSTVYMTMEYLSGQSLAQVLRAPDFNGLKPDEALRLLEGMAEALKFAHENGIVHADFKPANVFVTDSGKVKVIDFGIARAFQRPDQVDMEQTRFDPGSLGALTPTYASPEMLEYGEIDPRDDIYALACIAYEMLTGRHPFGRMQATEARDGGLQLERRKGLSQRQWRALKSALDFNRDKRTPTVEQFCCEMKPRQDTLSVPVAAGVGVVAVAITAAAVIGYFYTSAPAPEAPPPVASPAPEPKTEPAPVAKPAPGPAPVAVPTPKPEPKPVPKRYKPGETFSDCPDCPRLVVIPAGSYMQGSPASESGRFENEGPRRKVVIDYPFAVGSSEVTVGQYRKFVEDTGHKAEGCWTYDGDWKQVSDRNWASPGFRQSDDHPVTCVSWKDASAYVSWLSKNTKQTYRLLSAAEWEYIARAGDDVEPLCKMANVADKSAEKTWPGWEVHACDDGYAHTAPAGKFSGNAFGVHDTLGNVFEWVEDCWQDSYKGAPADGRAQLSGDCGTRELRGGSWFSMPGYIRSAFRNRFDDDYRSASFGMRVARVIENENR